MKRQIAITGLGAVTPLGTDLASTWNGVTEGRSGITRLTQFDASTFPVQIAGEVKNFTPDPVDLPGGQEQLAGRSTQLCLTTTRMALGDAGLDLQHMTIDLERLVQISLAEQGVEESPSDLELVGAEMVGLAQIRQRRLAVAPIQQGTPDHVAGAGAEGDGVGSGDGGGQIGG